MPQEIQDKAEYIVIFISEFARRYGLSAVQAYRYLNRYKAIDFLDEQYNVAHTQSFEDMVNIWRVTASVMEGRSYETLSWNKHGFHGD